MDTAPFTLEITQDAPAVFHAPSCSGSLDLRLGDCMEGMKTFPDGYFDLAVVDPPYGIGEDGGKFRDRKGGQKSMNTKQTTSAPQVGSSALFCVGLPDTQGGMCWLAGYESDPTRYYTPSCALTFETWQAAAAAIKRAKKTHPFKERTYRIMTVAEMETQNS